MKIRFMDLQFHNECNRSCWFCPPQCKNKPHLKEFMSINTLNRIIDFIKFLDKNNMINGIMSICTNRYNEPFCNKDLYFKYIKHIYEELKNNNVVIGCNTNGDLIDCEIIEYISKYIYHITISLYDLNLLETIKFINKNFKTKSLISNYVINKDG